MYGSGSIGAKRTLPGKNLVLNIVCRYQENLAVYFLVPDIIIYRCLKLKHPSKLSCRKVKMLLGLEITGSIPF